MSVLPAGPAGAGLQGVKGGLAAVVIIVYKTSVSGLELLSLRQAATVLRAHPFVLVAPPGLETAVYAQELPAGLRIIRMPEPYFAGIAGHNRLLVAPEFYRALLEWESILLHHLDAWVFRDELTAWCRRGYDYIGSPLYSVRSPQEERIYVGNGGLSLRRPAAFLRVLGQRGRVFRPGWLWQMAGYFWARGPRWRALLQLPKLFGCANTYPYLLRRVRNGQLNEDVFWSSLRDDEVYHGLRIPTVETAAQFSLEQRPADFMAMNGGRLPFGCHAWHKPEVYPFWRQHIAAGSESACG